MGLTFLEMKQIVRLAPYPRPATLGEEEKGEACDTLLKFLLREQGQIAAFNATYAKKRELVRGCMNRRPPVPVPADILSLQDSLFWTETVERGVVSPADIPEIKYGISTWEGDITRLGTDAIVNAANKSLLGCFLPGHACIDNVIHSRAGMQLRDDCAKLIAAQRKEEACGEAKITCAYNLPSRFVLHTVGPMVGRGTSEEERAELRSCYLACLDLAEEAGLSSVAFCCIATGVFNFPRGEAAEIATGAVVNWKLRRPESKLKVIFNTFQPEDTEIYRNILKFI